MRWVAEGSVCWMGSLQPATCSLADGGERREGGEYTAIQANGRYRFRSGARCRG